jgi:adenosylmethionine-8-amino-7-oxononanoate aminotransferase
VWATVQYVAISGDANASDNTLKTPIHVFHELAKRRMPSPYPKKKRCQEKFKSQSRNEAGILHLPLLRPLGNVVYFVPPYAITESEVAWALEQIGEVIAQGESIGRKR